MAMKLLIVLFFLLPAVALFAQKDTRKAKYFLLPESGDSISVNIWRGETVERVASYAGRMDKSTTDGQRYVAVMNYQNKLTIHDIKNKTILLDTLSQKFEVHSMFLHGNYLYLGGRNTIDFLDYFKKIDMLKSYNIVRRQWADVPIPKEVQNENKAVDDMVLLGDTLIAVDDLVFPKYLIYYKLDKIGAARLLGHVELSSSQPYELIEAARYDGKHFILRSSSHGMEQSTQHFCIMEAKDLHTSFKETLLSNYFYWGYEYDDYIEDFVRKNCSLSGNYLGGQYYFFLHVIDFALLGDKILFCHDKLGIAVVGLRAKKSIAAEDFSLPPSLPKGIEILKMTLTPNPNKVLLSVQDKNNKVRHELVEVK
jgi:hypothetical protein